MATQLVVPSSPPAVIPRPQLGLIGFALGFAVAACVLAGALPIRFSIVTVFLFAGPHNWFELRYFLARTPPRWGPLAPFFAIGIGGVLILTGLFAAMGWMTAETAPAYQRWLTASATWN